MSFIGIDGGSTSTKAVLLTPEGEVLARAYQLSKGNPIQDTIEEALERSAKTPELALCSYDMLGEGARTLADAQRYRKSYEQALDAIGSQRKGTPLHERSSLSVKLSALPTTSRKWM